MTYAVSGLMHLPSPSWITLVDPVMKLMVPRSVSPSRMSTMVSLLPSLQGLGGFTGYVPSHVEPPDRVNSTPSCVDAYPWIAVVSVRQTSPEQVNVKTVPVDAFASVSS